MGSMSHDEQLQLLAAAAESQQQLKEMKVAMAALQEKVMVLEQQGPHAVLERSSQNDIETFVRRFGTEFLIDEMIKMEPVVQRSGQAQGFRKSTLAGLFEGDRPTRHFWDLQAAFGQYYRGIAVEFFNSWDPESLQQWNRFRTFHCGGHDESNPEEVRGAARGFLKKENPVVLLKYRIPMKSGEDEHSWEAQSFEKAISLRDVLQNSQNVSGLMEKIPNEWYDSDDKSTAVKSSLDRGQGVKQTRAQILESDGWDKMIAGIGEQLVPLMNRLAYSAALIYQEYTLDPTGLYLTVTGNEDPLTIFVRNLDNLRRDTRLSMDESVHLCPDKDADGTNSHTVQGPFFMRKLPRELRAYFMSAEWQTSELGKAFGNEFGSDNVNVLVRVLRSTQDAQAANTFAQWRKAHNEAGTFRVFMKKGRYVRVPPLNMNQRNREKMPRFSTKPSQLNSYQLERGDAIKAIRKAFGHAFDEAGKIVNGAPLKRATSKDYQQARKSGLCHRCLSHPFVKDRKKLDCPMNKLDKDDEVYKAWSEFYRSLKPVASGTQYGATAQQQ